MITKIIPPTVKVKAPILSEVECYILNEYEFLHLRVQIKKKKSEGWKWVHDQGMEVDIDSDGRMEIYPNQFAVMENYLFDLM